MHSFKSRKKNHSRFKIIQNKQNHKHFLFILDCCWGKNKTAMNHLSFTEYLSNS